MAGVIPEIIVALDVPHAAAATALVEQLREDCRFYKVGSELFTAEGPPLVRKLVRDGYDVFLDLKLHDIPNTVLGAARAAAALGVRLLTVHASGGSAMLAAAVQGAGVRCGILGVTVLTSLSAPDLAESWGRDAVDTEAEVLRLAGLVQSAGAHGIVCSGSEAAVVRERFGGALRTLVPGVRLSGSPTDDQARVVTPARAAAAGASYVVLGRTVTTASDPRAALSRARAEMVSGG